MPDITTQLLETLTPVGTPERCGVVTATGELVEIPNTHPEPQHGFFMCPISLLRVAADAVATWHTHPGSDPNLSDEDYAGFMQWPQLQHHIVGVRDGKPTVHTFEVRNGVLVTVQ